MKSEYTTLVEHLKKAAKFLKWKLSFNVEFPFVDDELTFTIDGVEYFVSPSIDTEKNVEYYAAIVITHNGNREEPPYSDESPLKGDNTQKPEALFSRILDAHWSIRKQWVMESIYPDFS